VAERSALLRCPFVRLVAEDRIAAATDLALRPPDPADVGAVPWLIAEAQRQLAEARGD